MNSTTTEAKHTPFDRLAADLALERSRESTAALAAQLRSAWQECEAIKASNAALLAACETAIKLLDGPRIGQDQVDIVEQLRTAIASARKGEA